MIDQLPRIRRQRADVAHADVQIAQRPRIGEPHRLDRHGAAGALDRRLRHDADSDIALDQRQMASKERSCTLSRMARPTRLAFSARKRWMALARSSPTMS